MRYCAFGLLFLAGSALGQSRNPLISAMASGAVAVEAALLRGAPVNEYIGLHTPLTYAIEEEEPEIISVLLRHGADQSLPYAGKRFSRAAIPKGQMLWARCDGCHRYETEGRRSTQRTLEKLVDRPLWNGLPPTFENISNLVATLPAHVHEYGAPLSRSDSDAVTSYLLASIEPTAGLRPYELALQRCSRKIIELLNPSPVRAVAPSKLQIRTYAETMEQMVRLRGDLCAASLLFEVDTQTGQFGYMIGRMSWLLIRWRERSHRVWRPSTYDMIWPLRAAAVEDLRLGDPRAAQVAISLRKDLELAVEDCMYSLSGMGGVRPVNVYTMRDDHSEAGWQVLFKLKVFEHFPDIAAQPFPNLSSPASWELPPGNYLFYAKKQKQTSEVISATIDRRTTEKTQWQIPLP